MSAPVQVRVFAPGSISNIGPGFDALGMAVAGPGDTVVARRIPGGRTEDQRQVRLLGIEGDGGKLPRVAEKNTAGIAAAAVLAMAGSDATIELELYKGMAIGTGLGSSAASAAAAAWAVNLLLGAPFTREQLVGDDLGVRRVVPQREQKVPGPTHDQPFRRPRASRAASHPTRARWVRTSVLRSRAAPWRARCRTSRALSSSPISSRARPSCVRIAGDEEIATACSR